MEFLLIPGLKNNRDILLKKSVLDVVKNEEGFWYLSVCSGYGLFRINSEQPFENGMAIKICAIKHCHVKASIVVSAQGSCLSLSVCVAQSLGMVLGVGAQ